MENNKERKKWSISGVRYLFSALGFLGFFTLYAIRVNINVAIVAMVNNTAVYREKQATKNLSDECQVDSPSFLNGSMYDPPDDGKFIWDPNTQGVVLGAFYYGYVISQIPGGRLAEVVSAKWVFGIGTGVTALLTLITPLAANMHVGLLVAVRAVEGLFQGVTMPAMYTLLGRWIPDSEKGMLVTLVYCGITLGTVVTMPVSGVLCNSGLFGGWPSAFYIVGIFGCVWFVLWSLLISDSPQTHPYITKAEVKYITCNQKLDHEIELPPIPWGKIFTSVPFWALLCTQIGNDWFFYTIVNDLPTFFGTILHVNIEKNGFLSSFPYLLQAVVSCIVAYVTDITIRRKITPVSFVRKFCNTVASVGSAAGLIGVCFAGCNVNLHVAFFTMSITIGGFCTCGYLLSHLDLSPEYAGTLMGIANTISNLSGFLAPQVVGSLTQNQGTLHQWNIVFLISITVILSTNIIFVIFGSTKKQPWISECAYSRLEDNKERYTIQTEYGSTDTNTKNQT